MSLKFANDNSKAVTNKTYPRLMRPKERHGDGVYLFFTATTGIRLDDPTHGILNRTPSYYEDYTGSISNAD